MKTLCLLMAFCVVSNCAFACVTNVKTTSTGTTYQVDAAGCVS